MGPENILATGHSPVLCRVSSPAAEGLHKWLASKAYAVTVDDSLITLHPRSFDSALEHWASDTSRLLSAGRETLSIIYKSKYSGKSIAWALIQSYYAAFYYAHAVLRLSKQSITYTTTSNLLNLKRVCDVSNFETPFKLTTNQYIINLNEVEKSISINQRSSGDGTHENLWSQFTELIDLSAQRSKENMPDFENEITDIYKKMIAAVKCSAGETGYLSSFRNQIQYTQMHGAWHPYASALTLDECRIKCGSILLNASSIDEFNLRSNDNSTKFAHSSLFICWIAERFVRHVGNERKSFLHTARLPAY